MNKRTFYLFLISINIIIILFLIVSAINAFLTYSGDRENQSEIGLVDVEIDIYFEVVTAGDVVEYRQNIFYQTEVGEDVLVKSGVVKVDISTEDDPQFITNLRVNINVYSTVDTYFRVAPYEQLTYTYTIGTITREVASTLTYFMPFNYDEVNFFNNRLYDGFYYYKSKVKRIDEEIAYHIEFISEMEDTSELRIYDPKYSLQIGFLVEAVQAYDGPQIIWGLDETPWGEEW